MDPASGGHGRTVDLSSIMITKTPFVHIMIRELCRAHVFLERVATSSLPRLSLVGLFCNVSMGEFPPPPLIRCEKAAPFHE
jgi:hypothetical protein